MRARSAPPMKERAMKVALVCDTMSAYGGAERVIEAVARRAAR